MSRYRFSIDILDRDGVLTVTDINEVIEAAVSAAKIAVPADKKRSVKAVKPDGYAGKYHPHDGSECSRCYSIADDGQSDDVSEHFTAVNL